VPKHLQDGNRDAAPTGQGKDYVYPHEFEGHFIPQQYLPRRLLGTYFYKPSGEGYEAQVVSRLDMWREAQRKALGIERSEFPPDLSQDQISNLKGTIK
jgi:replication-associated recombination protein RarA